MQKNVFIQDWLIHTLEGVRYFILMLNKPQKVIIKTVSHSHGRVSKTKLQISRYQSENKVSLVEWENVATTHFLGENRIFILLWIRI